MPQEGETLRRQDNGSARRSNGNALRMLAAHMDAYTQATIKEGTTSVKVALNGLRVETKINLSGSTEVLPHPLLGSY